MQHSVNPQSSADAAPGGADELTLLFADIVGSSRLYRELGDAQAEALVNECLGTATRLCAHEGGTLIKTIGDAILCSFAHPDAALRAACAIQHLYDGARRSRTTAPLSLRIGFHHGPAVRRDGDVFGDAVNVAARVSDLAKGRQILTTDATVSRLDPQGDVATRFLQRIELRGRPGAIGLCEALLDTADLTAIGDGGPPTAGDRLALTTLLLQRGAEKRLLMRGSGIAMIGRGAQCDFVVDHPKTSRTHVRVERRGSAFWVVDHSANGTLVHIDGRSTLLRRDGLPLLGEGWISAAGREPLPEAERVQFRVTRDADRSAGATANHARRGAHTGPQQRGSA